jgi:histidinol-phosphate aminotransferase
VRDDVGLAPVDGVRRFWFARHAMSDRPQPYIPQIAASVVRPTAPGAPVRLDLSLNESSFGASPRAIVAAQARARTLERYPDPASRALRAAIGRAYDLDPARIACGNGSEELLDVMGRLFARPGDEILFTRHGFVQFPIVAMRVGATAVTAPERELTADVDALLAAVTPRTRVLFLANPNNPTGTWLPRAELVRLRDGLPGSVVLVIDAAYAEFVDDPAYDDGLALVGDRDNVVVTRTFSKAFGLAALRVGWLHGTAEMIALVDRMRGIGNVNAVAQAAAVAALEDRAFVRGAVARAIESRARLAAGLRQLGVEVAESGANFVLPRFPDAAAAQAHLRADGILVRRVEDYGLPDRLRIGVGTAEEVEAVLASLRRLLG